MTVGDAEDVRVVIIIMMTVMMTMMSDGYDEDPYLYVFHIFMFFIYDSKEMRRL